MGQAIEHFAGFGDHEDSLGLALREAFRGDAGRVPVAQVQSVAGRLGDFCGQVTRARGDSMPFS